MKREMLRPRCNCPCYLVVDDNEDNRFALISMLGASIHQADEVTSELR